MLHRPPGPDAIATDRWTAPFWSAARDGRLVVCACARCGTQRMPPGPFCPRCASQEIDWRPLPGTGRVYSYTIVRRAVTPAMEGHLPYAPAVIALDGADGVRLVSAVVDTPVAALAIDAPVALVWHRLASGDAVPYFRVAEAPVSGDRG